MAWLNGANQMVRVDLGAQDPAPEPLPIKMPDIVDGLESLQATNPSPALEPFICDARFARDSLARITAAARDSLAGITAAHLDALKEFVRDHPVGEPYDPDVYDVEK